MMKFNLKLLAFAIGAVVIGSAIVFTKKQNDKKKLTPTFYGFTEGTMDEIMEGEQNEWHTGTDIR